MSFLIDRKAASGIPWQYFLNMFSREALKKIRHRIPEAENFIRSRHTLSGVLRIHSAPHRR